MSKWVDAQRPRFPPENRLRSSAPRRSADFGDDAGSDYPGRAIEAVLAFVMLEDVGALEDLVAAVRREEER